MIFINQKWVSSSQEGNKICWKNAYDSTDLSTVLTTTDNVVTETMYRGVSHKAVALLDKRSNEQSLQRVSM